MLGNFISFPTIDGETKSTRAKSSCLFSPPEVIWIEIKTTARTCCLLLHPSNLWYTSTRFNWKRLFPAKLSETPQRGESQNLFYLQRKAFAGLFMRMRAFIFIIARGLLKALSVCQNVFEIEERRLESEAHFLSLSSQASSGEAQISVTAYCTYKSFSTFYVNQAENPRLTRFQWRVDHLALFAIVINVLVKTVLLMSASVKPWEGMSLSPAEYRKVLGAAKWREKNPFCNSYKSFRELRAKKR